jgi:GAF domain-containing protein
MSEEAIIQRLRERLEEARSLTSSLDESYAELQRRLAEYEADVRELSDRLIDTEQQANRLIGLYAGLYQLHATLDPTQVYTAVADVVTNLLGAERYALLLYQGNDRSSAVRIALCSHQNDLARLAVRDRYLGGDPHIDGALRDGRLRLFSERSANPVAVIPLTVDEQPVGVLVVFALLPHRATLGPADEPLIDLLAVHAASAVHSAHMHQRRGSRA